jgi:hypothetical protein
MAFMQSLINTVSLCANDPNIDGNVPVVNVGDGVYVSPVEDAAAFWFGSRGGNGNGNVGGGGQQQQIAVRVARGGAHEL